MEEQKIVIEGCTFHEFTADVQARVDALIAEAVLAEREACAAIAEDMDYSPDGAIAKTIRARSN